MHFLSVYSMKPVILLLILFLDEMLSSRNPRATHARIVLMHAAPSRAELDGLRPKKPLKGFYQVLGKL